MSYEDARNAESLVNRESQYVDMDVDAPQVKSRSAIPMCANRLERHGAARTRQAQEVMGVI